MYDAISSLGGFVIGIAFIICCIVGCGMFVCSFFPSRYEREEAKHWQEWRRKRGGL